MKAEELNAKIVTTQTFSIDCPVCKRHRISVPIGTAPNEWQWNSGTHTLTPSIKFDGAFMDKETHKTILCQGHFTIGNGIVNLC